MLALFIVDGVVFHSRPLVMVSASVVRMPSLTHICVDDDDDGL